MEKDLIIKEIEETINYNKTMRRLSNYVSETYKDASRKNNDVLAKARSYIKNNDEYSRGLDDCWRALRKLCTPLEGSLSLGTIQYLFGVTTVCDIADKYEARDVISILNEYEKEQEEKKKPKLGDVVEIEYCDPRIDNRFIAKGVYIKETDTTHNILIKNGEVYVIEKDHIESIRKTGEHVDILGVLEKEE